MISVNLQINSQTHSPPPKKPNKTRTWYNQTPETNTQTNNKPYTNLDAKSLEKLIQGRCGFDDHVR